MLYYYRVKSRDAAGNLATSDEFTFTTVSPDTTAPVISNVASGGITTTGATITWTTNENSDSQVVYGTTQAYGQSTTLNPALVTAHSQVLSGLADGMTYYYRVKSKDAAGNLATSAEFTFTTAQNGSAVIKWLVTDHLGSTRMVIDQTGSLAGIKRHDFLPFGEELFAGIGIRSASLGYGADSTRQKFTGYERDNETGLDFAQARYFSNGHGRFTSPDSFGGDTANPQTLNLYAYVQNNPLRYTDPSGHSGIDPSGTGDGDWHSRVRNHQCGWGGCFGLYQQSGGGQSQTPQQDNLTPAGKDAQGRKVYDCPSCDVRLMDDSSPPDGQQQVLNAVSYLYSPFRAVGNFLRSLRLSGGGFGYAGVGGGAGPVHGEALALVQYDSEEGGSHGGLMGAGVGHYTFGFEAMRTWKDWQEHISPIALGGIEIPGVTRAFGRQLNTHSRDIGGLAQLENGHLSLGIYGGITLPSYRTFGGGGYFTLSQGPMESPWNAPIFRLPVRGQ
jgi:RHS repeat-associated protein